MYFSLFNLVISDSLLELQCYIPIKLSFPYSLLKAWKDPKELKQAVKTETKNLTYSDDLIKLLR